MRRAGTADETRVRRLAVLVCLLALAPAGAAHARAPGWVINGTTAPADSYPWQVALIPGTGGSDDQFCGGTLIAPDRVATAAHCVVDDMNDVVAPSEIDVFAEQVDLRLPGQRRDVSAISVHPSASLNGSTPRRDAALLTLSSPITTPEPVDVIAAEGTAAADALWAPGQPVVVTGWGLMEDGELAWELQEAELTRITDSACDSAYAPNDFSESDMLCAGVAQNGDPDNPGGGLDSCNGDSGGGLLARTTDPRYRFTAAPWRLVGIVSWGPSPCDEFGTPGVYTRVAAPTIRSFLTGTAPSAPVPAGAPSFTGTRTVGATLACSSPGWTPATLDRELLEIYRLGDGLPVRVGTGSNYLVTPEDEGATLVCLASARSSGGQAAVESAALAIPAEPEPEPEPQPEPTPPPPTTTTTTTPASSPATTPPAPVPAPDTTDRFPPRATLVGRRTCLRRRRCTVTVLVSDVAPSAGILSVHGRLTVRRRSTCRRDGRRVRCIRTRGFDLFGRRLSGSMFRITTPRLPRGRHTLRVAASDLAGNTQGIPSLARLRVR